MAISVALVGGVDPKLIQIVVSATSSGVAWKVTGTAAGQTWTVPGGEGVGNGGQLRLVDNRTPLNAPITYTYTPATGSAQTSSSITAESSYGIVLQSLDGQLVVGVDLLDQSSSLELGVQQAIFNVPGRERAVVRYSMTGDGGGSFHIGMDKTSTAAFRELTRDGAPLLVRRENMDDDMPLVFVALFSKIVSPGLASDIGYREWVLPFVFCDDPYLEVALGAFTWTDGLDAELAGRTWAQFDSPTMAGRTWNAFDTLDWTTV